MKIREYSEVVVGPMKRNNQIRDQSPRRVMSPNKNLNGEINMRIRVKEQNR
jgi:hypothetical protein